MSRNTRSQSRHLWHLYNRGTERRTVFEDDLDRVRFLRMLEEVVVRFGWLVMAYVLMGNHFHLLAETPPDTVSAGLQLLDGWYGQYFNRRWKRTGALWQGRANGILVESDRYLVTLAQYIALNPVRARMVPEAGDYRWSSYRATVGLEPAPSWLTVDPVLAKLSDDRGTAQRLFAEQVARGVAPPWEDLVDGYCLGSRSFAEKIQDIVRMEFGLHATVPRGRLHLARPRPTDLAEMFERATGVSVGPRSPEAVQAVFAHIALTARVPLREVGCLLSVSKATAGRRARMGAQLIQDEAWTSARRALATAPPPRESVPQGNADP